MTLIERFKLDHPNNGGYSEQDVEDCVIGCPHCYEYTTVEFDKDLCDSMNYDRSKYPSVCVACWNREIPETPKAEPELTYEINLKEEKKMKSLRNLIVSKVDEAVDCVGPILSEAVRDAVRDALDNLFN